MSVTTLQTDFLVIGSGLAGLYGALQAAEHGSVTLVTKSTPDASSSFWAQGGVAAVLGDPDRFEDHVADTLRAGRGYGNPDAAEVLVREGAGQVKALLKMGMPFDKSEGGFTLGLEGGHSARRILHAEGAATGKMMIRFLIERIRQHQSIQIFDQAFVYDLIGSSERCRGAAICLYREGRCLQIISRATLLASGGYSGLFNRSTNPHTSTGDGLWLAAQKGAVLKDLEFVQFHPTVFSVPGQEAFLISEAVRGEGARLVNQNGERFMEKYEHKELSPRDLVSREIFEQNREEGGAVYLDLTHLNYPDIRKKFRALMKRIEANGIRPEEEGIPVAPAAHYSIGGIETDLNGQTSVPGLYACGEVAATGVHGANRLASNSLLECLVFSARAVRDAAGQDQPNDISEENTAAESLNVIENHQREFLTVRQKTAELLSRYCGVERNESGLTKLKTELDRLEDEHPQNEESSYYQIRKNGLLTVARLMAESAGLRKESRGVHSRSDFTEAREDFNTPFRFQNSSDSSTLKVLQNEPDMAG